MITLEEFKELKLGTKVVLRDDMHNNDRFNEGGWNTVYCNKYIEKCMNGAVVTIAGFRDNRQNFSVLEDTYHGYSYNYAMIDHIYDETIDGKTNTVEVDIYDNGLSGRRTAEEYTLVKVSTDKDWVKEQGNSEKFANIIAGKWVILNVHNYRIENELNPHIAAALNEAGIRNWKLDGWDDCCRFSIYLQDDHRLSTVSQYCTFKVNFETGYVIRKLNKGEILCPHCGSPIKKTLLIGKYCHNCLRNENYTTRFGYHNYSGGYPTPAGVDTSNTLVFGCEIERDYNGSLNDGDFSDNLALSMENIIKIFQKKELQKGTLRRDHVFMSDSSLNCSGLEWITFPHTFKWYVKNKDKFDKAINTLHEYGFTDTTQAGNHIHINRDFFGNDAEFNAAKISVLFNTYWKEFTSIARRDINRCSYTCKPSQTKDDSIFNVVSKTISNRSEHSVAVNLQHSKTIEIRLWSAIRNADDLIFFLDNMQALAKYVKTASLEKIQKAKFTDYMKYYKLKSSYETALVNLKENNITRYNAAIKQYMKQGDEE